MKLDRQSTSASPDKQSLTQPISERQSVYSSDAMTERRNRILTETRRMIAEEGLDKFSIRTLCKRASVAPKTIYNVFQSKDRLIAIAIREAYEGVNQHIRYRTSPETIEGIVDRLISVNSRNFKAKNYTRAVTSLYFSESVDFDVWNALRSMVFLNLDRWLSQVDSNGELVPWMKKEVAAGIFANLEYSIINDWAFGRIADDDYLRTLILAVLSLASGITIGASHEAVAAMLDQINQTGQLPDFPKPVFRPLTGLND